MIDTPAPTAAAGRAADLVRGDPSFLAESGECPVANAVATCGGGDD